MSTRPSPPDESDPKITVLFSVEERAEAERLARYWDATVTGRPTDPRTLDPELAQVVHLLRHYHEVTRHHLDVSDIPSRAAARRPPSPRRHVPPHPMMRVAIASMGFLFLLLTINTFASPRSWLMSTADDPDWIPWVSDDWLGPEAVTARSLGLRPALPFSQTEWGADGA